MHKWFEKVMPDQANIVSSRIRLARNWEEYVFPPKLTEEDSLEMIHRLKKNLEEIGTVDGKNYHFMMLDDLSEIQKRALRERRIFNSTMVMKTAPSALFMTEEEDVSLILNGADHIRLQLLSAGLCLERLWKRADLLDNYMNQYCSYAYDEKYGYLTSFPTNVGTGLRASVILHLPTLSQSRKFPALLTDMSRFGVSIKGVQGEERENYGFLYEISNQKTLGVSEKELIDLVSKVALQLSGQESQLRTKTKENRYLEREDETYKSYGVLKYARRLGIKECMTYLSQLMAGMEDELISFKESCSIFQLMLECQSANLQETLGRPLQKEELDSARADYIRNHLPDITDN